MPYKDPEKQKAAQAASYQRNKEKYRTTNGHANRTNYKLYLELKSGPCADCKNVFPHYVMQFDHTGTDKTINVSRLVRTASKQRMLDEIAKCELVCANCHAERSWKRQNNMPL